MKNFKWPVLIAITIFAAGCGGSRLKTGKAPGGEVVEADGSCPIINGDVKGARACALAEAQKQALERVIGLYISAKTRVDKAVTIEQNILAHTEGYISKYDILKDKKDGDSYKVKIRALVLFQKIGDDLKSMDILKMPSVGNPRVAVLITDTVGDAQEPIFTHSANGLSEVLAVGGYKLVDPEAMAAAKAFEYVDDIQGGDQQALQKIGTRLKAEIVVYGESRVSPVTLEGISLGGMKSYRATLSAKAARAQTGEVLHVLSAQASGLDVTEDASLQKALESVGRKAGEELSHALSQKLSKESSVEIIATVSSMDKVKALRDTLSSMPGIDQVYLRFFHENQAELDVILSKSGRTSVGEVGERLEQKLQAEVMRIEGNTLNVTIR